ncbi:MAG: caspase family protein, partial [Verrucomicrobia bacterium]|nr:caspase family protein [Verrucomicrobiota bacterium]
MKRAVSIGWNRVDPRKWGGWRGDLPDCELDASRMAAACELLDAPAIPLLTAVANRTMCRLTLWASCSAMAPGDTLIVHTSGHGGQRVGGNEPDGREEYICAYDGPIDDDTVWYWLSNVPAGVRVVWFCDTCHSGGMARNRVAPFVFRLIPDELQCGVILIS